MKHRIICGYWRMNWPNLDKLVWNSSHGISTNLLHIPQNSNKYNSQFQFCNQIHLHWYPEGNFHMQSSNHSCINHSCISSFTNTIFDPITQPCFLKSKQLNSANDFFFLFCPPKNTDTSGCTFYKCRQHHSFMMMLKIWYHYQLLSFYIRR